MSNPDTKSVIGYATAAPSRRRYVFAMIAIIAAAIMVKELAEYLPGIIQRSRQARSDRTCMNYTAPADAVVYSDDPKLIPGLAAAGLLTNTQQPQPYVGLIAKCWADRWPVSTSTLFLHGRTADPLHNQLVGLNLYDMGESGRRGHGKRFIQLIATVILPGSPWRSSKRLGTCQVMSIGLRGNDVMTLYAGQPDALDSSHFVIRALVNDKEHWIDGWLKSDGTVRMTARDGTFEESSGVTCWWPTGPDGPLRGSGDPLDPPAGK
jgi:hypothetical protein